MRHSRSIALFALLALGSVACAATFQAGAAVVNGVSISQSEVDAQVDANPSGAPAEPLTGEARLSRGRDVLLTLIQAELIRQEANDRGIEVASDAIEAEIARLQGDTPDAEFQELLTANGFTDETLRAQLRLRIQVEQIQADLSPDVSTDEVRSVYDLSKQQFEQAKVKHILFAVEDPSTDGRQERKARAALVEIQGGANFDRIAKNRSDDPGSAQNGGRLPGWTTLGDLDPSFAQATADARIGAITEPVRSRFGWHLILVLDRRFQPFKQVKDGLRAQLQQQEGQAAFQTFLLDILASADVEVNPRYGEWDPDAGAIVPGSFFTDPDPEVDPLAPPFEE